VSQPVVIAASADHIPIIADNMRQADRDEVWASSGKTPGEALAFSLGKSSQAWTVLFDGVPAGMFGVGDLNILTRRGAPWFLGTDAVEANRRAFLRHSVHWRDQLLQRYDVLMNLVDDRNTASIRWLRWLGFSLSEPFIVGFEKRPFRLFELRS
jgi:hypothetical protein